MLDTTQASKLLGIILPAPSDASVSMTASRSRSSRSDLRKHQLQPRSKQALNSWHARLQVAARRGHPQFGQTTISGFGARGRSRSRSASPEQLQSGWSDRCARQTRSGSLANTPSGVLIGLVGNRSHRTHAWLTLKWSEKCPKEQLRSLNPVRLRVAHPTIDVDAGGLGQTQRSTPCKRSQRASQ